MKPSLETFIEVTEDLNTVRALFSGFNEFVSDYGFHASAYHIITEGLRSVGANESLIFQTFPTGWQETYLESSRRETDPLIQQAQTQLRPFHWFDAGQKNRLSEAQKDYLEDLKGMGFKDGLAIAVCGPLGTFAFFSLGRFGTIVDLTSAETQQLQYACAQVHGRYLSLSERQKTAATTRLSKRERQALGLIATGLSNNQVAARMNISENTVDTLVRRTYAKLGVNNRVSAVLCGVGSGMIAL